jgi:hypothetical protein
MNGRQERVSASPTFFSHRKYRGFGLRHGTRCDSCQWFHFVRGNQATATTSTRSLPQGGGGMLWVACVGRVIGVDGTEEMLKRASLLSPFNSDTNNNTDAIINYGA